MASNKGMEKIAIVGVGLFAVLVVAGLYWMFAGPGSGNQAALTNQQIGAGSQQPAGPNGQASATQLAQCNSNGKPNLQVKTFYYDPNNNNAYTQVATSAQIYNLGGPSPLVTLTTTAANVTTTADGTVSCGSTVKEIAGDGGTTYYYADSGPLVVPNTVVYPANNGAGIQLIPSGTALLAVGSSGALTNNPASTLTYNWTAAGNANGSIDQNIYVQLQGPNPPAMFGDLGVALCIRYNQANFSQVNVVGATPVAVSHVTGSGALPSVSCFALPPLPTLVSTGPRYVNYNLQFKGATLGPENGTTVDLILVDKTNQIYNSFLVPSESAQAQAAAAANQMANTNNACLSANGYDNCNSPNSGIGVADLTRTGAITFER